MSFTEVETEGVVAYGTQIQLGDGALGDATKASKTNGNTNSQIVYTAKVGGVGGNSIAVAQIASGNNTPLSIAVVGSAITVTLETDGSAASASTVNDVIAKLYATAAAAALVDASDGVGDGTGVLAAAASGALSGGAAGTEAFVTIAEVTSFSSDETVDEIEFSHLVSPDRTKEYKPGMIDPGSFDCECNFVPASLQQRNINYLKQSGTLVGVRLIFNDGSETTFQTRGFISKFSISGSVGDKLSGSFGVRRTAAYKDENGDVIGAP